uniref:Glutathione peroxidase n=1 Tax=Arion vulgaris TaxID=1028688 RepID=A0A0B7AXW9_9EUPU
MATGDNKGKDAKSIYEFSALDIDGNNVSLEKYRGKICIIVNVACKCGFTNKNYKQLQAFHEKYADKGLAILAFPSNEFAGQEPESNENIKKFVQDSFGVKFDLFSKIEVNGKNAHPLYNYLKNEQKGTLGNFIKWNFSKFLINREGKPVNRYAPSTDPNSFEKDIEKLM